MRMIPNYEKVFEKKKTHTKPNCCPFSVFFLNWKRYWQTKEYKADFFPFCRTVKNRPTDLVKSNGILKALTYSDTNFVILVEVKRLSTKY